ncbi:response regulator transcription factor [Proteobacteria bacterium 005FR1]|nr:response regulator transcription factor [Proteobacteria bacterium 005FR1]
MCNVYIVEDHPEVLLTYEQFLQNIDDLEVCGTAESAEAALQAPELSQADMALIDVSLPGMSGIDLVRQLHDRYPDLPCLMVSGHSEEVYARSAYEAGAKGYIMKGNPVTMVDAIHEVLKGDLFYSDRMRRRLAI